MVGNDTNLDILQLALRITSTTEVLTILAKHLEWDRGLRHLRLPTVTKNLDELLKTLDHIGPRAYLCPDRLHPSGLTLATPWKRGWHALEHKYPWITLILQSISSTKNTSILAPYGISLVTSSLTGSVNDAAMAEDTPSHQSDRAMCPSEMLGTTLGISELEDATAENQWHNSATYGQDTFLHSVQIGGTMMKKSHAIAQQFHYVTSASSADHLCCVAQESRFKPTRGLVVSQSWAGDAHIDVPTLSILQPITTVVVCEGKLFLCIAEVNGLFLDHQPVDDIPLSVLSDKAAQVLYQGL